MNYRVEKEHGQFEIGDEVILNPRQAQYLLLSGHIGAVADDGSAGVNNGKAGAKPALEGGKS
jgi:hypothetical protein